MSLIFQKPIRLSPKSQGFHLITKDIFKEIPELPENGIMHLFIKHTSAGLTLNENASPDVRYDFHNFIQKLIPESFPDFLHTLEGPDDMPAHIKASLIGQTVTIPIINKQMALGTWQGIYLGEFRKNAGPREIIISIY
ncbi:MAG: secondary thiamine-phosphate synthase enzyme YjbQ [Bacteroidales bacterium]